MCFVFVGDCAVDDSVAVVVDSVVVDDNAAVVDGSVVVVDGSVVVDSAVDSVVVDIAVVAATGLAQQQQRQQQDARCKMQLCPCRSICLVDLWTLWSQRLSPGSKNNLTG